jgi:hypothetical protein
MFVRVRAAREEICEAFQLVTAADKLTESTFLGVILSSQLGIALEEDIDANSWPTAINYSELWPRNMQLVE